MKEVIKTMVAVCLGLVVVVLVIIAINTWLDSKLHPTVEEVAIQADVVSQTPFSDGSGYLGLRFTFHSQVLLTELKLIAPEYKEYNKVKKLPLIVISETFDKLRSRKLTLYLNGQEKTSFYILNKKRP